MLYKISQFIARGLFRLYFRVRIEGKENIPKEGGYIIVANHISFLDPLLICTIVPRIIHYLTYAIYYYARPLHWFCKRVYCIPIKKDGKDISGLKKALRLLKSGELIGIFPEGERSQTGQLQQPEPGVALIALRAKVPILPVGIRGAYEAFPRGAKFPKPQQITITFGKPFRIDDHIDVQRKAQNSDVQQHVLDLIMSRIADVCSATYPKAIA
jgi:1-acyl-sn-glycerol-3-phosphate acyltransferase